MKQYIKYIITIFIITLSSILTGCSANIENRDVQLIETFTVEEIQILVISDNHISTDKFLLQLPELPTGCEAISLTNALIHQGYSLDKFYIADNYLLYYTDEYQVGFRGSPYSYDGTSTFPKCIVDTANNFLMDNDSEKRAYEISGTEFDNILEYIDSENTTPIIWTTSSYGYPYYTGDYYTYDGYTYANYYDEHCILICGYDKDTDMIEVYDPLQGKYNIEHDTIMRNYNDCGRLAVVIY